MKLTETATGNQVPPHVIGRDDDGAEIVILPEGYELSDCEYWLDEDGNAHVVVRESLAF